MKALRRWGRRGPAVVDRLRINLALQGGGALGAFTWGVLDQLLDDPRLELAGISGASAGALNAVAVADGFAEGGAPLAQQRLRRLRTRLGALAPQGFLARLTRLAARDALAAYVAFNGPGPGSELARRRLRQVLEETIDFERLRRAAPFPLAIAATHLASGTTRIFNETEISADILLASACLPQIFDEVMIDGEAYWDGGLSANPPILEIVRRSTAEQTWVVRLLAHDPSATGGRCPPLHRRTGHLQLSRAYLAERERFEAMKAALSAVPALVIRNPVMRRLRRHRIREIDGASIIGGLAGVDAASPTPDSIARLFAAGRAALPATASEGPGGPIRGAAAP